MGSVAPHNDTAGVLLKHHLVPNPGDGAVKPACLAGVLCSLCSQHICISTVVFVGSSIGHKQTWCCAGIAGAACYGPVKGCVFSLVFDLWQLYSNGFDHLIQAISAQLSQGVSSNTSCGHSSLLDHSWCAS